MTAKAIVMLPVQVPTVDRDPKCWRCGKFVGVILTRPWQVICARCNATNSSPPDNPLAGIETK